MADRQQRFEGKCPQCDAPMKRGVCPMNRYLTSWSDSETACDYIADLRESLAERIEQEGEGTAGGYVDGLNVAAMIVRGQRHG